MVTSNSVIVLIHCTYLIFDTCVCESGRSPEVDLTPKLRLAFLSAATISYNGAGMVESAWTTTAYSCDEQFREHTGQE